MSARFAIALGQGAERESVTAWLVDAHNHELIGTADGDPSANPLISLRQALDRLVEVPTSPVGPQLQVYVCPPLVQVRTLHDLPPVRERDLLSLVGEQRERFFRPIEGTHVVAARWAESDGGRVAKAALADAESLEAIEATFAELGFEVASFVAASRVESLGQPGLSLRTSTMRAHLRRCRLRHAASLGMLMALGWLVPGVAYVVDLKRDNAALELQLASIDTTLSRVDSLQARVAGFIPVAAALRRQGAGSAWATGALVDIAEGLPRGLHLHALALKRDGEDSLLAHWDQKTPSIGDSITVALGRRARVVGDPGDGDEFAILLKESP